MRNPVISILKAIAITLVVMAHSCCPTFLSRFAYMICVSLFFMASGYCFNTKYIDDPFSFITRRFKGLYVPFLKWSIILLVLNNLFFCTGILNETYGNAAGGVTHPLNFHQSMQSLWSIAGNMSGYDQFLGGAYWFFRAMLISSIVFIIGMKILDNIRVLKGKHAAEALILASITIVLAAWQCGSHLRWTGVAQGGYRELMGVFFLAAGVLCRNIEQWISNPIHTGNYITCPEDSTPGKKNFYATINFSAKWGETCVRTVAKNPILAIVISSAILVTLTVFSHPSMAVRAKNVQEILCLALSGVIGFWLIKNLSTLISKINPVIPTLLFVGNNTLYIFGWHMLSFKLVSIVKVLVYGLPWLMVGGHPVVHSSEGEWFWILYTIVGITLPLAGIWIYRYCDKHYDLHFYIRLAKTILRYSWQLTKKTCSWGYIAIAFIVANLWKGLLWTFRHLWKGVYEFCMTFADTVKAGADVHQDEEEDEDPETENDEIVETTEIQQTENDSGSEISDKTTIEEEKSEEKEEDDFFGTPIQ